MNIESDMAILAVLVALCLLAVIIKAIVSERKRKKEDEAWAATEDLFNYRESFNIAGVNKHGLVRADCGTWKGFVECEPDNPYDPHAVAVIKGATKHIGYLNREIAATNHEAIAAEGGKLPCIVRIERKFDDDEARYYFVGRVQILWPGTA